jgi:hypothetical protein
LKIGKFVMFAADIVGAVWNEYAPDPPLAGPARTEFWGAAICANASAGVLVGFVTFVVNRGLNVACDENIDNPPLPPLGQTVMQLDWMQYPEAPDTIWPPAVRPPVSVNPAKVGIV